MKLSQSIQEHMGRHNQPEDNSGGNNPNNISEVYFDEAKQSLMKDLVDFHSRGDFDQYMKSLEKKYETFFLTVLSYYEQMNLPKPPYESLPAYPPKPFQKQHHCSKKQREEAQRDYIEKVNELNEKRSQAFSYMPSYSQQPTQSNQNYGGVYQSPQTSYPGLNQFQTPFFDQMVNKENFMSSQTNQAQMRGPTSSQGTMGMNFSQGDKFLSQMEPQRMQVPPQLSRFVAGPTRLEKNPLSAPNLQFRNQPPQQPQPEPFHVGFDLRNPDVQYDRYKQLMHAQYYNHHANSTHHQTDMDNQTIYHPPPPFSYQQQPPSQQQLPQQQVDNFNVSFAPGMQSQRFPQEPKQFQQQTLYPSTSQIYNQGVQSSYQPGVQIYNQPTPNLQSSAAFQMQPEVYRQMKYHNQIDPQIIESIGGIENTVDEKLTESLKQHELRPFYIQHDYHKEYKMNKKGKSLSDVKLENMKLVSVSPFRAVIKEDSRPNYDPENENKEENSGTEEEDYDDEIARAPVFKRPDLGRIDRKIPSPIKNESENQRNQREQFLNMFNDKRQNQLPPRVPAHNANQERPFVGQPTIPDHQMQAKQMRSTSQHMRNQREQFLNSFSNSQLSITPPLDDRRNEKPY